MTSPACTVSISLNCRWRRWCANADITYVFADAVHPTPAVTIISDYAPHHRTPKKSACSRSAAAVEQANFRAIDGRMWSGSTSASSEQIRCVRVDDYGIRSYGDTVAARIS